MKPEIFSIEYSLEFPTDIGQFYYAIPELKPKLEQREEIRQITYSLTSTKVKIYIVVLTDSVKKYDPKYNIRYWQEICQLINNHLKEE